MSRSPLFALIVAVGATVACSVFMGGPDIPTPRPVPSEAPLPALAGQIEQAITDSLSTGTLSLQISQEQLTAYVASKLNSQDPRLITDPQIILGDQQMILYGRASSGMVAANISITTEFGVDSEGMPQIHITDAQMGPLPMPQALQDAIAAAIDEALTGSIGPAAIGFRLESIEISAGVMTITGRVR